jgi:hypothetical protein
MYGLEAWFMTVEDKVTLNTWEMKILKGACGSVTEQEA